MQNPGLLAREHNMPLEIISKKWVMKSVIDSKSDLVSKAAAIISYPDTIIIESKSAWNLSDSEICGGTLAKLNFLPFSVPYSAGMMTPKNSPYREIFNIR